MTEKGIKAFSCIACAFIIFGHMKVTIEMIDRLSDLARLDIPATEKESLRNDLEQMIGFIEKLNELDTTGVEPLLHMSSEVNVLRPDEPKGSVSREEALQNAALKNEAFVLVPKMIKK